MNNKEKKNKNEEKDKFIEDLESGQLYEDIKVIKTTKESDKTKTKK